MTSSLIRTPSSQWIWRQHLTSSFSTSRFMKTDLLLLESFLKRKVNILTTLFYLYCSYWFSLFHKDGIFNDCNWNAEKSILKRKEDKSLRQWLLRHLCPWLTKKSKPLLLDYLPERGGYKKKSTFGHTICRQVCPYKRFSSFRNWPLHNKTLFTLMANAEIRKTLLPGCKNVSSTNFAAVENMNDDCWR